MTDKKKTKGTKKPGPKKTEEIIVKMSSVQMRVFDIINSNSMLELMCNFPDYTHDGAMHEYSENCSIYTYFKTDIRTKKPVIFFYVLDTTTKDMTMGYVGVYRIPYSNYNSFRLGKKFCSDGKIKMYLHILYYEDGKKDWDYSKDSKILVLDSIVLSGKIRS